MPLGAIFLAAIAPALLSQAPSPHLQTPAHALAIALADAKAHPADAPHLRFLWLGNGSDQERADLSSVVSFAVNSLSRRRLIVRPAFAGDRVLRIDLRHYGITTDAWDDLALKGSGPERSTAKLEQAEPYFHLTAVQTTVEVTEELIDVPWYRHTDGKMYNTKWEKRRGEPKTTRQVLHAPWIPSQDIAQLAALTQTDAPILRADYFLRALWPPSYQKFLGLKKLSDFEKLVRFRKDDLDLSQRAIVAISSQVALHNRSLTRVPTSLGVFWKSFDFLTSVGDQDLLTHVFQDKADAHEIIASLPNNLHGFLLTNAKDEIIDVADGSIALDRDTPLNSKLVWVGYSCVVCHDRGFKPFADSVRRLADRDKSIYALVGDPKKAERFQDEFGPHIEAKVVADQQAYATAVQQACGMTPDRLSATLSRIFVDYYQGDVDLKKASHESGYPQERILAVLRQARGLNHTLVELLGQRPVRRDQWEHSGYGQLMSLLVHYSAFFKGRL